MFETILWLYVYKLVHNQILAPDTVKLTTEGDLTYFDQMQDDVSLKSPASLTTAELRLGELH